MADGWEVTIKNVDETLDQVWVVHIADQGAAIAHVQALHGATADQSLTAEELTAAQLRAFHVEPGKAKEIG